MNLTIPRYFVENFKRNFSHLDGVCNKAEDGSKPQQTSKAREEILTELYPFWSGGGRGELIETMLGNTSLSLGCGQTICNVGSKPFAQNIEIDFVNVELKLFFEIFCFLIFTS